VQELKRESGKKQRKGKKKERLIIKLNTFLIKCVKLKSFIGTFTKKSSFLKTNFSERNNED
jgi:hypothetical protein